MGEGLIKCRSCSSATRALHPPACGAACSKESGQSRSRCVQALPPCAVVNFGAKSPPSQRQQRGQFQNWNRFSFVFALNVLQLSHFLMRLLTVAVTCHLSSFDRSIDRDRYRSTLWISPCQARHATHVCGPAFILQRIRRVAPAAAAAVWYRTFRAACAVHRCRRDCAICSAHPTFNSRV